MPHVSTRKVDEKLFTQMYKLLFAVLTSRNCSKKSQRAAFEEILTPTEKIMLGKRLAAVVLLSQGLNSHRVGQVLKLSPTTTTKLETRLEQGELKHLEKICDIERRGPLINYLAKFLDLPRYGTGPASLFRDE